MKLGAAWVVFIVFAVLFQPWSQVQVYADFVANSASDSTLASKFAPVLVLTKNPTRPGRKVLRPEPVEIMGAESILNVYFSVWSADGTSLSQEGRTPAQWRELENLLGSQGFSNVNAADNKFAYLDMDFPAELGGEWVSPHFFDYPGEDKESWNREYESGPKAGKNFPNTVYARVFTRDAADNHGSVIIKYFCFYPYNDFTNDHEGDWAKINVKVTSRNPQEAEVYGVDFKFHGNSLVYDRDEITTNPSMVNFRNYISIVGNANPVIYVGAGSHANLPRPGIYTRAGGAENLTPHGIVLHPTISRPIQNIAESYKLVMLPDPFSNVNNSGQALVDNMGLEPEMSWLGADLLWGTPMVDSPGANFESLGCMRLFGSQRLKRCFDAYNDAPRGPFYTKWRSIDTRDEDWSKDNVPEGEFHHFPIVGDVTWSGTVSLRGDIVVFPGATLTVTPGTVIEFEPEEDIHKFPAHGHGDNDLAEIFVYGTLTTESGTQIQFRKKSGTTWQGDYAWGGIRIMPGGTAPLDNAQIRDNGPSSFPPTSLTAEPGDGQVTLRWGQPVADDPMMTGWQYRRKEGVETLGAWGDWIGMSDTGPSDTEYTVRELAHGVFHKFQVRAVNTPVVGNGGDGGAAAEAMKVGLLQVSYSAETYDVVEGNTVEVTVRLTPPADRAVTIPVQGIHSGLTGSATSADYSLSTSTLRFDVGDNSRRFTLTAHSNTDGIEVTQEDLFLGFGTLPAGVRTGSPEGSTGSAGLPSVTIHERSNTSPGGTIPNAPTGNATAQLGRILVSWDKVTADPKVTRYTLRFQSNPVLTPLVGWSSWNVCPLPVTTTTGNEIGSRLSFPHEGLSPSRKYRYQLQATNSRGDSDWSGVFPENGVSPGVPKVRGFGIRTLGFGTPTTGDEFEIVGSCIPFCDDLVDSGISPTELAQFEGFQLEGKAGTEAFRVLGGEGASGTSGSSSDSRGVRQPVSSPLTFSNRVAAVDDRRSIVSTHRVSDLDKTKTYQFRVRAVNADGVAGEASDSVAVIPLRAQAGTGQVRLSWDNPGNAETIEEWQYRQQRGRGSWGDWQDVPGSTASTASHPVTGLANGEEYWFQVRAVYEYAAGDDRAGAVSFSRQVTLPDVPDAPGNLEAEPGDSRVTLRWADAGNDDLTGWKYRVRRSALGSVLGEWQRIAGSEASTRSHTVPELSNGQAYTSRVRAGAQIMGPS